MRFALQHLAVCALIPSLALIDGCTTANPAPDSFTERPPIYDLITTHGRHGEVLDEWNAQHPDRYFTP